MKRAKLIRGILVVAVFLTLLLFSSGLWATKTAADPGWKGGDLEGLPYRYMIIPEDDGSYTVLVSYSLATAADIQTATTAMTHRAEKFVKGNSPFEAEIVFSRPLSVEEFRVFVRETGVAHIGSIARGIDSNGQVVELHIPPVWARDANGRLLIRKPAPGNDPLDSNTLDRAGKGQHTIRLVGIIAMDVFLDRRVYADVKQDQRVYAVDIMKQVLIDAVRATGVSVPNEKIDVVNPSLYAYMEKVGIVPKVTP